MQSLPLTVKRSIELLGLVLLGFIVNTGQQIIMPMLMAFFVSIVLLPVYNFLTKRKFPRALAIFLRLVVNDHCNVPHYFFYSNANQTGYR